MTAGTRLYLVRHGQAMGHRIDDERPLSPHGAGEVRRVAEALKAGLHRPACFWHSGKRRARETAEIFRACLHPEAPLAMREYLRPDDPVDPVAGVLQTAREEIMIVGHLPYLGLLAARLLFGPDADGSLAFSTGTAAVLNRGPEGRWSMEALLKPADLPDG